MKRTKPLKPHKFKDDKVSTSFQTASKPKQEVADEASTESISLSFSKVLHSKINKGLMPNPTQIYQEEVDFTFQRATNSILTMKFKKWSDLNLQDESVVPQNLPESKHKKLYQPWNIRVSAGANWEYQNSSSHNLVSSKSQEQNIELSVEYLFHKRWGIQTGLSWNQKKKFRII